jgi:para-nitrobenzyl esterase
MTESMNESQPIRAATRFGVVEGIAAGPTAVWRGIPYAAAPIGRRRFHLPDPPDPWTGVLDATRFGPIAMQRPSHPLLDLGHPMSEDCLTLNVWAPANPDGPRPVLVWIHGGGLVSDSGSRPTYDGTSFASLGLVVVTMNYRLGPFGFLYLGQWGGSAMARSGNLGLLDQVAALRWVRDNIAAFGGDPNRVTVAGESSGALSVATLMTMPAARGLMQQAILQSLPPFYRTPEQGARSARRLLEAVGLSPQRWEALYDVPADRLMDAYAAPIEWPMVDGASVPRTLFDALKTGTLAPIPLLIGSNRDETRLWAATDPVWMSGDDDARLRHFAEGDHPLDPITEVERERYCRGRHGAELLQSLLRLSTVRAFEFPAQRVAAAESLRARTFLYRFDWQSPAFGGVLGACHAMELPFVFNTLRVPGTELLTGDADDRQLLADRMHSAWAAFVSNGDPNVSALPPWPPYDTVTRFTMLFDREPKVVQDPDGEDRRMQEDLLASGAVARAKRRAHAGVTV